MWPLFYPDCSLIHVIVRNGNSLTWFQPEESMRYISPSFSLPTDDDKLGTLDAILGMACCRTQMYLSKQMAQLRPEITMPMFSGKKTHFQ